MGIVLHDNPRSLCAQRVRFLLAELELPYERRTVPLEAERPARHLAVNPAGGVPALVDGELAMAESVTILRYLASREGRADALALRARRRPDRTASSLGLSPARAVGRSGLRASGLTRRRRA